MIRSVQYAKGHLRLLDQMVLPEQTIYLDCTTPEEVAAAIKSLQVRGAPLIGITAAFGLVLAMRRYTLTEGSIETYFARYRALLLAARPTAVNLAWALGRMDNVFQSQRQSSLAEMRSALEMEAETILAEDVAANQQIGRWGARLFSRSGLQVMTLCNAGALATGGYGTALGVFRALHARRQLRMVWVCETRPVLQGSRLTVWELTADHIPVTLITDSMAAAVMREQAIDAVVVGADRIAANGDVANKIGSYGLAVLAAYHEIPFYVAAPVSTFDAATHSGKDIPIEERDAQEVRAIRGCLITAPDTPVYNPAFDVVPRRLITAIVTENGVKDVQA